MSNHSFVPIRLLRSSITFECKCLRVKAHDLSRAFNLLVMHSFEIIDVSVGKTKANAFLIYVFLRDYSRSIVIGNFVLDFGGAKIRKIIGFCWFLWLFWFLDKKSRTECDEFIYFQSGSFCQSVGNPIALMSIFG